MIDNYLVDARQRFDMENELKAKQKQEQIELHEKLKREIYLNGGYVDCVNPGCVDQGTAETSYLCKPCFKEQTLGRTQQQNNTARFYSIIPPASMPSNNGPVVTFRSEDQQQTHARGGHAHQLNVNKQLTCTSPHASPCGYCWSHCTRSGHAPSSPHEGEITQSHAGLPSLQK